jgi:ATPase family associated with various cellular activities (AAA)
VRQVRETSRRALWRRGASAPVNKSLDEVKRDFSDVILPAQLSDHVRALAAVTSNTKRHGAPFRHMLFYGPPGTGKTMAAKRFARTSGLDYAIMSGGDVAPLGGNAVTQIHELFDWAERSKKVCSGPGKVWPASLPAIRGAIAGTKPWDALFFFGEADGAHCHALRCHRGCCCSSMRPMPSWGGEAPR